MTSKSTIAIPEDLGLEWSPVLELASREVFELMLSSQLAVAAAPATEDMSVTAMVGLAGVLSGLMKVRCGEKAAALMASKMLGMELDQVGAEIADALGEVCNMVAGNFKNKISGLGDGCMLSPPSVVTGADYEVHSRSDNPTLAIAFLFETLPVAISLHIHA
jgi:chemotaxis protein CheX